MTQIKPTYVTFEQAKRLKEKEFNEKCTTLYNERGEYSGVKMGMNFLPNNYINYYSRPEQWQVVEWLKEVHDIWVEVNLPLYNDFRFTLINIDKRLLIRMSDKFYDSPQEAYSAAFNYVLNNLI